VQVHRGVTRVVLLAGRWAVKVPSLGAHRQGLRGVLWSLTRGIQANLSECEWSGSPGTCPVLWSAAGLVNVYPRCEPVIDGFEVDWDSIGFLAPVDRKPENVGWLRGALVLLDYDMSWNDCVACRRFGFTADG